MANNKSSEFVILETKITKSLSDQQAQKQFLTMVRKEFDNNSGILSDNGLSDKPIFSKAPIWKLTGLTDTDVKHSLQQTKAKFVKAVFGENLIYVPLVVAIRYYTRTKNENMTNAIMMYATVMIYSMLHRKYFTLGFGKKEVMDYTINNLSNKYDIKRLGSLLEALKKLAQNNHENYAKDIVTDDDDKILDYIEGLRTRVNSFIKNIYGEFKKNYQAGNYLKQDPDSLKGEEDKEYEFERSSNSTKIMQAAQAFNIWFVSNPIDDQGIKLACNYNRDVSVNHLKQICEAVKMEHSELVEEIAASIMSLMIDNQKGNSLEGVCSISFIPFVFSVFSRSNTSDFDIIRIKNNLSALLEKYSDKFNSTNREATKISYRKALLIYLSFAIQKQRC